MKDFLTRLKDDKNLTRIIFIIGMAGILIIFFNSLADGKDGSANSSGDITASQYGEVQEDKLCEMIEKLSGAGKAKVMLTMENSAEHVYTKDLQVKSIEPRVRGVVVICQGAGDELVKANIMELVTKALNISADRVCVTKGNI